VQVTAVPLKLRGELDDQGVIDLLSSRTSTRTRAAHRVVRSDELVNLGLTDGPPTLQRRRRLIDGPAF